MIEEKDLDGITKRLDVAVNALGSFQHLDFSSILVFKMIMSDILLDLNEKSLLMEC